MGNHYVQIPTEGLSSKFFQVKNSEPFEFETGDEASAIFAAVTSGSESGFKPIDVIEPDDSPMHLYYVLWGVKDGCKYFVKIDTGTNRFGIDEDKDIGYITNEKSPYFAPDPAYAFWLVNNHYPSINAVNVTKDSLTPKVWFRGFKYDLVEVKDPQTIVLLRNYESGRSPNLPFKRVTIGGVK